MNANNKVEQFFNDELLINITHDMYQEFMDAQHHNTKSTNEKLNKKIRAFVKHAFEHNKIQSNFTNDVSIQGKKPNKKNLFISAKEYELLLNYLHNDNLPILKKMMILLAATTGIRYGELCAVRWKDIDFERQSIHIHQQWDYKKGSGFIDLKDPNLNQKDDTDIKERTIPLSSQTMALLKTFQKSDSYIENEHGRLFYKTNCKAQVMSNNTFNKSLNKVLTSLNIESITAHGLRHSFATYQVHKNIDRAYLQYLMGHTDYRTTDKYYVHLHEEMFEKNALEMKEALDKLVN
ncbi:tyrosine-type recombinase/integrase [Lysinibacillus capsici]|uniref:tyrosine-type recombinase/integrase n=1 Tax=Lysinibacillus capsici TaxID=2115968 RepID=UPI00381DD717